MEEIKYRGSRICRLLGNPVVYRMSVLLAQHGPSTPRELAGRTGRTVSTISIHLAKLRTADLVRYETAGKITRYWLKHGNELKGLLKALDRVVHASTRLG